MAFRVHMSVKDADDFEHIAAHTVEDHMFA